MKRESALKIQKSWRGKKGRNTFNQHKIKVEKNREERERKNKAVNCINARVRGYHTRKRVKKLKEQRQNAALKIQNHTRRYRAKREVRNRRWEKTEQSSTSNSNTNAKIRAKKHHRRKKTVILLQKEFKLNGEGKKLNWTSTKKDWPRSKSNPMPEERFKGKVKVEERGFTNSGRKYVGRQTAITI